MKYLILLFALVIASQVSALENPAYAHLTYSQVGYDTGFPKNAMFQDTASGILSSKATFTVRRIADNKKMVSGKVEAPREKWGKFWWKLDFSACNKSGAYFLEVYDGKKKVLKVTKTFPSESGKAYCGTSHGTQQHWNTFIFVTA